MLNIPKKILEYMLLIQQWDYKNTYKCLPHEIKGNANLISFIMIQSC